MIKLTRVWRPTNKPLETKEIAVNPREIRMLSNGQIYDDDAGVMLDTTIITWAAGGLDNVTILASMSDVLALIKESYA